MIANAPHPAVYQRLLVNDPVQRASAQYVRLFRDPASDAIIANGGLLALLEKVWGWQKPEAMDAYEYEELLAGWEDRDAATAMLNWYRASPLYVPAMDEPYEIPADRPLPAVPPLTIPTLVIWALEDFALPPENLEGIDELVKDLTLVKVPGSGHFVPWEAPAAVNAAMDGFLGRTG